jgi:hypothetical protein
MRLREATSLGLALNLSEILLISSPALTTYRIGISLLDYNVSIPKADTENVAALEYA